MPPRGHCDSTRLSGHRHRNNGRRKRPGPLRRRWHVRRRYRGPHRASSCPAGYCAARRWSAATEQIGFGNVIKILLRFETRWWADQRQDLRNLSFLLSDERIPVWWTQFPDKRPVLTGWFGGPKTEAFAHFREYPLIEAGIVSLADIFELPTKQLKRGLVASRAINWRNDRFARGAYSYATLGTRHAQAGLASTDGSAVLFSGEALYRGKDIGTVEAALSSGLETARHILALERFGD
jgi:monoamine oxidase